MKSKGSERILYDTLGASIEDFYDLDELEGC